MITPLRTPPRLLEMATLEALPEPLLLQAAGSLQGLAALAGTSAGLQGHAQPWLGTAAYACKACGHRLFRPSLLTQVQQSGMAWGSAGPLLQLPRCAVEPPSSSTALGEEQPEPDVDVECEDEGAPSTPRCVLRRTRLPSGLLLGIEAPAAQEQELRQELWRVNSGLVPVQLWQDPSRVVLRCVRIDHRVPAPVHASSSSTVVRCIAPVQREFSSSPSCLHPP